jgi:hypothetical protein
MRFDFSLSFLFVLHSREGRNSRREARECACANTHEDRMNIDDFACRSRQPRIDARYATSVDAAVVFHEYDRARRSPFSTS